MAWSGGTESGRTALRSATGPVRLEARADRAEIAADPLDLAYVALMLVDGQGTLCNTADRAVEVSLEGPGVLQALSSANPSTEEGFGDIRCTTFDGRALAVVRPAGAGQITLTATADGCEPQHVLITARA